MKRMFCLLLALVMIVSLGSQAFADDVLFCRICGKQIPVDSKVCPYCGEKVVLIGDNSETPGMAETKTVPLELKPTPAAVASSAASDVSAPSAAAAPAAASAPADTLNQSASAETYAAPYAASAATDTKPYPSSVASPVTSAAAAGPFGSAAPWTSTAGFVRITKNPTSESVPYGGSCMFIAHADNATSVTWYIASSDNSLVTTAAEATSVVSGLYVSGAYSDALSLSGIPSWMNGCKVQACFSGEGGPVYSEPAWIWTYQPAQQCNSGWTWWDWFCYYCCDDPCYWDYPWFWYNYWCDYPHCAPFWFDPGLPYDPGWPHNPGRPDRPCEPDRPDRPDRPPFEDRRPVNPDPPVDEVIGVDSRRTQTSLGGTHSSASYIPESFSILMGLTDQEPLKRQDYYEPEDYSSVPEHSQTLLIDPAPQGSREQSDYRESTDSPYVKDPSIDLIFGAGFTGGLESASDDSSSGPDLPHEMNSPYVPEPRFDMMGNVESESLPLA